MKSRQVTIAAILLLILLGAQAVNAKQLAPPSELQVSDGKTPIPTGHGTTIIPPIGAPMIILPDAEGVLDETALPWGVWDLTQDPASTPGTEGDVSTDACTNYRTGWYENSHPETSGGHMGAIMYTPNSFTYFCAGSGLGYTNGVSFGGSNWIQTGKAMFSGETSAKWFCQANNNGALTTKYGPANQYASGTKHYLWFARDSGGTWRTYRYDPGGPSYELGCTIVRAAGGNVQFFGEIQSASSTSADMGPWRMDTFQFQDYWNGIWYLPPSVTAFYPGGTPCPPYGAHVITSGYTLPGSGQACTTGSSPYPN